VAFGQQDKGFLRAGQYWNNSKEKELIGQHLKAATAVYLEM